LFLVSTEDRLTRKNDNGIWRFLLKLSLDQQRTLVGDTTAATADRRSERWDIRHWWMR
jgi:hypothetical protein